MSPPLLLLAVLAATATAPQQTTTATAAPQQLDLTSAAIDPAATAAGLRARAGPRLDGWTITVRDSGAANEVEAVLRSPAGERRSRRLTLTGATTDDRSRELAASLALLVEEDDPGPDPDPNPPKQPPPPTRPRGWLGLGPRLEVGSPPAGGLDLIGGAWLARDHVQPLANLAWSSTASEGLRLHSLRIGAGVAAGAPLRAGKISPVIWLGGHVLVHAQWVQARDAVVASAWTAATEVGGLLQVRWSRVVLAARTGVDLNFPPLALRGAAAQISRGPAAWLLAINFGFVFG